MLLRIGVGMRFSSVMAKRTHTLLKPQVAGIGISLKTQKAPILFSPQLLNYSNVAGSQNLSPKKSLLNISIRQLHSSPVPKMTNGNNPFRGNPFGGRPPSFTRFTFNTAIFSLAVLGLLSLMIYVLPFLFVVFFPLIIAGVVVSQIKSYRRRKMLTLIKAALQQSRMKLSNTTSRQLLMLYLRPQVTQAEAMGIFNGFGGFPPVFGIQTPPNAEMFTKGDFSKAERFISFVEARVLESLKNNEHNISSELFGDGYIYDPENIEFSSRRLRISGSIVNTEIIGGYSFEMLAKDRDGLKKPVAVINIISSGQSLSNLASNGYKLHEASADEKNPVVICIRSHTLMPKCFFITDIGETGKGGHYTVHKSSDGHREYTYHE